MAAWLCPYSILPSTTLLPVDPGRLCIILFPIPSFLPSLTDYSLPWHGENEQKRGTCWICITHAAAGLFERKKAVAAAAL